MLNTVMNVKSLKEAKALRSQVAMGKQAVLRLNQTVKGTPARLGCVYGGVCMVVWW